MKYVSPQWLLGYVEYLQKTGELGPVKPTEPTKGDGSVKDDGSVAGVFVNEDGTVKEIQPETKEETKKGK